MTGPIGYRGVAVVIAAYAGAYSIIESSYERQWNFASSERYELIAGASSGNPASFIGVMKNFGSIQTMDAYEEPFLFEPWNWWKKSQPNSELLLTWARHYIGECEAEHCGEGRDSTVRIDLNRANLRRADLRNILLHDSDLRNADLRESDLEETDLYDANLGGADLRGANLTGTILDKTDLGGADLRGVSGLTCKRLQKAKEWGSACRDSALACDASIPEPESCGWAAQVGRSR